MENQLTVTESSATPMILNRNPIEVLEDAKKAAQALTTVISQKKKPVMMNGEQYLEFEDWQTVGQFYGYMVATGDAVPVEIDGVKGAKASAKLVNFHTGETLGGAEAYCMRDEEKWKSRPKYEWRGAGKDREKVKIGDEPVPWFQLASMAQTRAGAKALRNRLAWVVVLAGYRPTPAEEIQDMINKGEGVDSTSTEAVQHYCTEHKTEFFMRGKMKSFAHPIKDATGKDTGEWCHEHTHKTEETMSDADADALFDQGHDAQSAGETSKAVEVTETKQTDTGLAGHIDTAWLRETMAALKWKDLTFLTFLKGNRTKLGLNEDTTGKTAIDAVTKLNQEQAKKLTDTLGEMLRLK